MMSCVEKPVRCRRTGTSLYRPRDGPLWSKDLIPIVQTVPQSCSCSRGTVQVGQQWKNRPGVLGISSYPSVAVWKCVRNADLGSHSRPAEWETGWFWNMLKFENHRTNWRPPSVYFLQLLSWGPHVDTRTLLLPQVCEAPGFSVWVTLFPSS